MTAHGRKEILIVEDNELDMKLYTDSLRSGFPNFVVHRFKDAVEAFSFVKEHPVDLIHVDCQLPEHSGLEFLAWCGAIPRLVPIPKMMITCFQIDFAKGIPLEKLKFGPNVIATLEGGVIREVPAPQKYFRKPFPSFPYMRAVEELLGVPITPPSAR